LISLRTSVRRVSTRAIQVVQIGEAWRLGRREQAEALTLLVARVAYDSADSTIAVTFQPSTIKSLAKRQREEAA
jgi:hypothetical protein